MSAAGNKPRLARISKPGMAWRHEKAYHQTMAYQHEHPSISIKIILSN